MAKKIMIQGTMSNVGKSLITAGLCRIFQQDGYKVAPFKSQNMALNSYLTKEGLEMGRAQVIQAEAAKEEPSVHMNPILLKPSSDVGSQVIVQGEVLSNMSARDYFAYKKKLIPKIMESFEILEENHDIIVIEGAGSPAEINLKQDDIVNMGLAKLLNAPVLLVGDIDRGGVFAQLIGTLDLLEEDEKALVQGLIINKFRGDKTILDPGIVMLEEKSKKKIAGVTPYMQVDIEEEDSLTQRFYEKDRKGLLDLVVIRLPRISNFTDFHMLETVKGVSLRYVSKVQDLGNPDLIFLPGSKSTMADLQFLRSEGLEAGIFKLHKRGVPVFGICGGYQMLGQALYDPDGVEGEVPSLRGMKLLNITTTFGREKIRRRVTGKIERVTGDLSKLTGANFEGYEIHMGMSQGMEGSRFFSKIDGEERLEGSCGNNVYGTYVHGIFDREEVLKPLLEGLCKKKGILLEDLELESDYQSYKEEQYELLAKGLREHLDMDYIYQLLETQEG